jgi:hypothetical protein
MLRRLRSLPILALAALTAWAVPAVAAHAQPSTSDPSALVRPVAASELRSARSAAVDTKDHQCVIQTISCGETVQTSITAHDCQLEDNSYYDLFEFFGEAGQTVTVDMSSNSIDPFLFLLDPDDNEEARDDDGGPGNNSRIVCTLDETSDRWLIVPNALDPFSTGPYSLSLQCSGGTTTPPGFFSDPAYPDFRFRVRISAAGQTIDGVREPDCQQDTVCVSGALPGRSELFIRILGPRLNGFLWPTLVRFTPSRVVVDIYQVSSDFTRTYELEAIPPGTDELPGLQDRTGFVP